MGKGSESGGTTRNSVMVPEFTDFLPRDDRIACYGIDCADILEWRMWTPGGEYQLNLNMKNVSTKPLKLKYKLPATKYFSMDFPDPIKLSPGMSFAVKVTFRPVKKETYDDYIEFITATGGFRIPIRATLPLVKLQVPAQLHFGYVPANEVASKSFVIKNAGEIGIHYKWKLNEPFCVEPAEGYLDPKKSASVTATFKPEDASVFVAQAVCTLQDGERVASLKVVGVGKYSHISLETNLVDFDSVLVGHSATRVVRLSNHSVTDAAYAIQRKDKEHDRVFRIAPTKGRLRPSQYENVSVTYTPNASGVFSSETFVFTTASGNAVSLCCRGSAVSPEVRVSTEFLNFGNTKAGDQLSRTFHIDNLSGVPVLFQIMAEKDSAFSFSRTYGECAAHSQVHVSVTFTPQEAANYWKRIYILVHDCQPLYINLIGTCYDEKRRPPPFHRRHVEAYLAHSSRGKVPTLDEMSAAVDAMATVAKRGDTRALDVPRTPLPGTASDAEVANEYQDWGEFFNGHDPARALSINESEIDYGACSHLRMSEYRTIVVTNNTDHKLTACWLLPDDPSKDGGDKVRRQPVFQVFPDSSDIKPRSSVKFKAQFRPTKENQYYCQTLECLAFLKSQRNFRLVSGEKLLPPWTASVQARGHTFYGNVEEFLPRANFLTRKLNFPPCPIGCSVYLTTVLRNNGDTPVKFEFQDSLHSLEKNILVKPRVGIVPSGGSQIIGLCFSAHEARVYNESLLCVLNDSPRSAIELHLAASGNVPSVITEKNLYFKPTCVGALSHRKMEIQNASRIPVRFAWSIPDKAQGIFSVEPQFGILRGNEKSQVTWTMIPNKLKKFETRVSCGVTSAQEASVGTSRAESVNTVTLLGEGTEGEIVSDPRQIDFGTVCIGKRYTQTLTLLNQAAGVLAYDLDPVLSSGSTVALEDVPSVEISESTGILPARAFKTVDVSILATKQGSYEFDLKCYGTAGQKVAESSVHAPHPLLTTRLKAHAAYPTMQITDLKGRMFEKRFLWDFCGIGHINKELSSDLLPSEVELNCMREKEVVTTEYALSKLPPISLQLGAEEEGEDDTVVFIEFTNTGGLPTEFKFHFQNDAEVEVENWIDVGEPQTEEGKHHSKIIENKIFDVQPRTGVLNAGQTTVIKITYTHQEFGYHELPVLLYIKDGRRINLHLKGETILKEDMRTALPQRHVFNPVLIGDEKPPTQVFTLHNKGVCEVPFFFETEGLAKFREENYGCDVFEFLDSDGIIPVNGVSNIRCIFRPLEHKEYSVDLPVILGDGTKNVVTFCGQGLHPSRREDAASARVPSLLPSTELPGFHVTPHLITYDHLGSVSIEHLDFSNVRGGSVRTKILAIKSNSPERLKFSWYIEEATDILGENLSISPKDGVVEPGQVALCRVRFDAMTEPIVCSTRIKCLLESLESSDVAQMESDENNGEAEEIIAEHPPPDKRLSKKRGERAGVYEGITFSTRMKFERLNDLYTARFDQDTREEEEQEAGSSPQEPQLIYVGIDVSVLPEEHISVADLSAELEKLSGGEASAEDATREAEGEAEAGGLWGAVEGILGNLCLEIVNDEAVSTSLAKLKQQQESVYKKLLAEQPVEEEPEEGPPLTGKLHDFVKFVLDSAVFQIIEEEMH